MTMTTARTQRQALVLGRLAVAVAVRPSAHLEVIPERDKGCNQTTDPQQWLGQLAQGLQHLERTLCSSKCRRHILGAFRQPIHLHLNSHQPVVDFSVGYIVVVHSNNFIVAE